ITAATTSSAAMAKLFHDGPRSLDGDPCPSATSNRCRAPTAGVGTGSSPSRSHKFSQSDRYARHSAHDAMWRSSAWSIATPPREITASAIASRALAHVVLASFQFTVDLPKLVERAMRAHARGGRRTLEHARDVVVS